MAPKKDPSSSNTAKQGGKKKEKDSDDDFLDQQLKLVALEKKKLAVDKVADDGLYSWHTTCS